MKYAMPKIQAMALRVQTSNIAHDPKMVEAFVAEQQAMTRRLGFKPTSQLWNFAVLPIYFGWFFGIRDLVKNPSLHGLDWVEQSFYWLPSMTQSDPYFIIPCLATLISFSSLRAANNSVALPENSPEGAVMVRKFLPFLSFGFFPLLATFPVGLSIYFATLFSFNYAFVSLSRSGFTYWLADMKRIIEEDNKYETEQAKKFEEGLEFNEFPKFIKPPKQE